MKTIYISTAQLNDQLFGKVQLFIRFPVRAFLGHLKAVCILLPLLILKVGYDSKLY